MLNWLSGFWGRAAHTKGASARAAIRVPIPHISAVAEHNNLIWPNFADAAAQARVYSASSWVYVAVNRIAEAGALVPLHVYRLEGERRVAVDNHPLERLLNAPNPFMSRFELFEATLGYLELTGNAYWYLAGDAAGIPTQIWPLRPDRLRVVPDERRYVRGYVVEIDGQQIPLEAVEVVHFKRWHPGSDYYGLSTLEAGRNAILTDRAMTEWNRSTFGRDHAVPAGIVNIRNTISQADYERVKREWRDSYGGVQRKTAFLQGAEIEWQSIGLNHNDLDFLKGRQANRDEILNLFGIPVGLVSENATEANAKVAERAFIERTLWPKLVRIAAKISQELLAFWPGDHIAEFADIRPTDTHARLNEIQTAYPVLSINEIRARYFQLPSVPWGDAPASGLSAGKNISAAAANPPDPDPTPDAVRAWYTAPNPDSTPDAVRAWYIAPNPDSTPDAVRAWYTAPAPSAPAPSAPTETTTSNTELPPSPKRAKLSRAAFGRGAGGEGIHADLSRWERFAIKRLNRPNARAFSPDSLPDETAFEIQAALLNAHTEDEVHAIFNDVRERLDTEAAGKA